MSCAGLGSLPSLPRRPRALLAVLLPAANAGGGNVGITFVLGGKRGVFPTGTGLGFLEANWVLVPFRF